MCKISCYLHPTSSFSLTGQRLYVCLTTCCENLNVAPLQVFECQAFELSFAFMYAFCTFFWTSMLYYNCLFKCCMAFNSAAFKCLHFKIFLYVDILGLVSCLIYYTFQFNQYQISLNFNNYYCFTICGQVLRCTMTR